MERKQFDSSPVAFKILEAARRLEVSPMTIRRLLARGALTRVRVGRSVRVLASSVSALAERGGEA
jgi:excisionase family DNA binding protein